ncbi:MAG: hypothetical protein QOE58_131, partial [Actinomycetota bacterium]|nr:hypothetical protein [Actinomycetota bacterium]
GGGAGAFRPWVESLSDDCCVLPVHLPGREGRFLDRPYRRMAHVVKDLVAEIEPLLARGVVFWGHSMGAGIAVALTAELIRIGLAPPRHLLATGAGSPDRRVARDLVHLLDDARLTERLLGYAGTPVEVLRDPDLLRLVLPVIRADFELSETWVRTPAAPLPIGLTVLQGSEDTSVSQYQLDGWAAYSHRPVRTHVFSGGHFFIRDHVSATAEIVRTIACEEK